VVSEPIPAELAQRHAVTSWTRTRNAASSGHVTNQPTTDGKRSSPHWLALGKLGYNRRCELWLTTYPDRCTTTGAATVPAIEIPLSGGDHPSPVPAAPPAHRAACHVAYSSMPHARYALAGPVAAGSH